MRRALPIGLAIAILLVFSAAVGAVADAGLSHAGGTGHATGHPAAAARPSACPRSHRRQLASRRPGAAMALVPAGAVSVLVCRYNGLAEPFHPHWRAFALLGSKSIAGRRATARLASRFNRLPPAPTGPYAISCPADFGDAIVVYFRYRSGGANPVTVALSGCAFATNGPLVKRTTSSLLADLKSLVPVKTRKARAAVEPRRTTAAATCARTVPASVS